MRLHLILLWISLHVAIGKDSALTDYENPKDDYVAADITKFGASLTKDEFQITHRFLNSVLAIPVFLFLVGVTTLGLFTISQPNSTVKKYNIPHSQNLFRIITIIILIAAHCLFIGYKYLYSGSLELFDDLNSAKDEMTLNSKQNEELLYNFYEMSSMCSKASTCDKSIRNYLDEFDSAVGRFDAEVKDVPGYFSRASDLMVVRIVTPAKVLLIMMYLLMVVSFVLNCIFINSKQSSCGSIACGRLVYLTGLVFALLVLVWVILLGNLCVDNPTIEVLQATAPDSLLRDYLVWYSSCYSGHNRLLDYTLQGFTANEAINRTISNDPSLYSISPYNQLESLSVINIGLYDILKDTLTDGCATMQRAWLSALNDVMCESFYPGMLTLWISQTVACICMFALFVLTPIIDRKHDMFKQVAPASHALSENHSVETAESFPPARIAYKAFPKAVRGGLIKSGMRTSRWEAQQMQVIRNDVEQDMNDFENL